MQRSFLFRQKKDVVDDYAKDLPVPASPPVPPPTAPASPETASPSSMS